MVQVNDVGLNFSEKMKTSETRHFWYFQTSGPWNSDSTHRELSNEVKIIKNEGFSCEFEPKWAFPASFRHLDGIFSTPRWPLMTLDDPLMTLDSLLGDPMAGLHGTYATFFVFYGVCQRLWPSKTIRQVRTRYTPGTHWVRIMYAPGRQLSGSDAPGRRHYQRLN